jgi:hypothetical protein
MNYENPHAIAIFLALLLDELVGRMVWLTYSISDFGAHFESFRYKSVSVSLQTLVQMVVIDVEKVWMVNQFCSHRLLFCECL